MIKSGVYKLLHRESGASYIGSAFSFAQRRETHFRDFRNKSHHVAALQKLHNKGEEIEFIVLELVESSEPQDLIDCENKWIKKNKNCLNVRGSGAGRKALPYRTTTIRVPLPLIKKVKERIKEWKFKKGY